ncbi:hypothetical protein [Streptomyces sp. NPDC002386]
MEARHAPADQSCVAGPASGVGDEVAFEAAAGDATVGVALLDTVVKDIRATVFDLQHRSRGTAKGRPDDQPSRRRPTQRPAHQGSDEAMAYPHHDRRHATQRRHARTADRRARTAARRWRHDGSEPRWASSDLPARRLLSRLFGALFALGAAGFAVLAWRAGPASQPDRVLLIALAALCATSTAVAIADLYVIRRRTAEQRRWNR